MSLDELKQQRANIKKNISRIKNIVEASLRPGGKPLSNAEYKCRLGILESYFKNVLSTQTEIENLDADDGGRADLEELYITTKLSIQSQLPEDRNETWSESTCVMQTGSKLPKLKLPSFNGKYSEYQNFITSFKQIIDKEYSLSNIEKFNHLRNCLQGPALETIDAFPVSNENYTKALERLKSRYDNPTLIFLENISSLFELSAISKPNGGQLRSLIDKASAIYGSLLSLGTESQISQAMLIYLVLQKADEETNRKWKESLDFQTLPSWADCTKVLDRRCQYLDSVDNAHVVGPIRQNPSKPSKSKNPSKGYSFAVSHMTCSVCSSNNHKIQSCDRFKALNVSQRFEHAKKMGLCINCLSKGHQLSNCASTHKCKVCSRQHHSLLHRVTTSESSTANSPSAVHTHMNNTSSDHIILATAMVLVRDASGNYRLGRALLDSCSQVNFITDELSQKLMLPRSKHNIEIQSIGESSTNIKYKTSTNIKSQATGFELPLTFCITSHIAYQPEPEIDTSSWNIPSNIVLADDQFYKTNKIDLLLGTESFFSLLSVGQIKLGSNLPILQKTLLGWVVSGRYRANSGTVSTNCLLACAESIDSKLEKLWQIEEVSTRVDVWTRDQHTCEKLYNDTVTRNSSGRIIVKIPFKDDPAYILGESYTTALRRFNSLERRLERSPNLKSQYGAFMDEYQSLGHMEVVPYPNLNEPHYYIPHHCVLKPNSTSTKLRVVFDASCRTSTQKSINDLQLVGPTIQSELVILLLRFRLHRFALTADIVKMYRQVMVSKEHRKFQYILWRSSPNQDIKTYQLNTVTYGMASAPYLAIRSLNYLADQYQSNFVVGANIIKSSFYVDDLLCGADSVAELSRIQDEVTELLKLGGFDLAKWHSNNQRFRCETTDKDLNLDTSLTSTLGLKWDQIQDNFIFSFLPKQPIQDRVTKRTILSIASSLFDPLGLVAPVIVTAKILLQELWLLKLEWDESVPQNIQSAWQTFVDNLSDLSSVKVSRYCLSPNIQSLQIHGFCDSSIRAYGCGIYTRIVDKTGNICVRLLTAKSRVAPTKRQSLPKLELCGALLLARLYTKIKPIFSDYNFDTFLWTDSQIVLHWLKLHSATLSAFVGNRVSEIQDLTGDAYWRHVPTKSNPADIVSRGSTPSELANSIWLSGPAFLYEDVRKWPYEPTKEIDMEVVNAEVRKSAFKVTISSNYLLEILDRQSSHTREVRIVARMLRFCAKLKKTQTEIANESLTPDELHRALLCIVWNVQQQHFAEDIRLLQKEKMISGTLRNLNPFLDTTQGFELLKVGGRLELADLPDNQKHPILLPNKCEFVTRHVRYLHIKNYHAGPKALVALIRLQFWIVNARELARRIVRSCIHCVRYKPKLLQHMMGNLPVERLTPSRPFSRCGVDFCGPFNVYLRIRGKVPYKAYVAIFVCFATKAVHIEVVSDLSTDAFLAALKRMIGRRGLPSDIFCDNATNFVGACSKLVELKAFLFKAENKETITNYCSNEFINFHFIPPRAPHFGGIWEAAVKSAKGHLHRSVMNARLTYEELTTVLVDIEAVLNSRPISPLSSDPSDFEPLTPGHFLTGSALRSLPERMVVDNLSHLDKWNQVTALKQIFWKRWSHEYISELQSRTKWNTDNENIAKDKMVLIHEDNVPPQRWLIGRVIDTIPGRDGRVRVVNLRTTKGTCRRPIHKIAILPI